MYSFLYIIQFLLISCFIKTSAERSFIIDYANNQFLKDGQPFRYISGSLHYFRVPPVLWYDRMVKFRAAGLNAIQTYIEWSSHEPQNGTYEFSGNYDLIEFLRTAQKADLLVILRPGPFIDAERDMGGLPYWLLSKNPEMKLRTSDSTYMKELYKWYSVLLPKLVPMLYKNGGPVISVQVENEYGGYGCDFEYTTLLRDFLRKYLGNDVILFTTDNNNDNSLKCGKIDDVFATVDFGTDSEPSDAFAIQRRHQEFGPYVNSEFYPGWLDYWEEPHSQTSIDAVCNTLDKTLALNASINVYMFHGGTSFGFGSGSNIDNGIFKPCPTSYDYDAPLSEAGDPTPKYYAMREVIGKYIKLPDIPIPKPAPKMEIPPFSMRRIGTLFDLLDNGLLEDPVVSLYPQSFEELEQSHGFVLYSTNITFNPSDPAVLEIKGLADRAQVFVDLQYAGILSRTQNVYRMPIDAQLNSRLDILVENQGRICSGHGINELKGITSNVTLGPMILTNWEQIRIFPDWRRVVDSIPEHIFSLKNTQSLEDKQKLPTFYLGQFKVPDVEEYPLDTFLSLDGWKKGIAFLNKINLGRYWPIAGPQITLYSPKHLFRKTQINNLVIFELEDYTCEALDECKVQFVKNHVVNGSTPYTQFVESKNGYDLDEFEFLEEEKYVLQDLKSIENEIEFKQINTKKPADPVMT